MKLYRIRGWSERFKQTGMLGIDHVVSSNLTELKKECTRLRALWRKEGLSHKVRIESIETWNITASRLAAVLSDEDTELLVKETKTIQEWEYEHTEPIIERAPDNPKPESELPKRVRGVDSKRRRVPGKRKPQRKRKG